MGVDGSGRDPVGIGGEGKRGIGKREDRSAVNSPVAVLVPAGNPHPDLCPAGQTSISSIPASCAHASFKKNVSLVVMGVSLRVYMGWGKDEGCGTKQKRMKEQGDIFWLTPVDHKVIPAGIMVGDRCLVLLHRRPFPEHGADVASHHFPKTEQEPFLYTPGSWSSGIGEKPNVL